MAPRPLHGPVGAVLAFCLSVMAVPARAEEDYMEVQRCVWRCQANYPKWSEYEACTQRMCSGPQKKSPAASSRTQRQAPAAAPVAAPAPDIGAGGTFGTAEGGITATLSPAGEPGTLDMKVEVSTPGCIGSLSGPVRPEAGVVTLRPAAGAAGQGCTVTGRLAGADLVLQDTGCEALRGPGCPFSGTLPNRVAAVPAAAVPLAAAPPRARWVFGNHPIIGRSAHVQIGNEVYGVACLKERDTSLMSQTAAIRLTPGLAGVTATQTSSAFAYMDPFNPGGVGEGFTIQPGGYVESQGDACSLPLDFLKRSGSIRFLPNEGGGIMQEGNRSIMTVQQNGRTITLRTQADVLALTPISIIPLDGARAALDRMLRECPILVRQYSQLDCN